MNTILHSISTRAIVLLLACGLAGPTAAVGQTEPVGKSDRGSRQPAVRTDGTLDLNQFWSGGRATGNSPVKFTHSPMRIADIERIVPYGMMVGGHVCPIDHQYYFPKPLPASGEHFDVVSPADGHLVMIGHRVQLAGSTERQRDYDDYQLHIEHSATFYTHYDLLTKLDAGILEQLDASVRDRFARKQMSPPVHVRIPIKAGQVLGKVGGRSLDFGAIDTSVVLKGFLNPTMYGHYAWRVHTVDPFDYFDAPLRAQFLKLNPRQAEPRGGKIDFDVDGRLIGNWFREGTGGYSGTRDPRGYWMGHLAVVYHHIDPSQIIVSIGDFDGRPRQFAVVGNAPDPAKVSESTGPVKYELVMSPLGNSGQQFVGIDARVQGVLLVEVLKDRKLRVEPFIGKKAAEVTRFTEAARTYER